ncbi:MAG: hypothetical protein QOH01_2760 [Verrucomicrobiota bacterium]
MAKHAMLRNRRGMVRGCRDKLASTQELQRGLDCALRQPRLIRQRAQARIDRFPSAASRRAVEVKVNQIRRRLPIVPDDVAHKDVDYVIIHGDGFAEPRHGGRGIIRVFSDRAFSSAVRRETPASTRDPRFDTRGQADWFLGGGAFAEDPEWRRALACLFRPVGFPPAVCSGEQARARCHRAAERHGETQDQSLLQKAASRSEAIHRSPRGHRPF